MTSDDDDDQQRRHERIAIDLACGNEHVTSASLQSQNGVSSRCTLRLDSDEHLANKAYIDQEKDLNPKCCGQ